MEQSSGTGVSWPEGEGAWESTSGPGGVSVSAMEDEPTLTVATIVGVSLVVLIAIVIVFVLGILIDCRQQKRLEKKITEAKRARSQRRASAHPDGDAVTIVDNMEEAELSVPPAETLRTVP